MLIILFILILAGVAIGIACTVGGEPYTNKPTPETPHIHSYVPIYHDDSGFLEKHEIGRYCEICHKVCMHPSLLKSTDPYTGTPHYRCKTCGYEWSL